MFKRIKKLLRADDQSKVARSIYTNCGQKSSIHNVSFISNNKTTSWKVRAYQIASCRSNWSAHTEISDRLLASDIVCLVKTYKPETIIWLKQQKKIIVYDILDVWGQHVLDKIDSHVIDNKIISHIETISPSGIIFPTECMQQDVTPRIKASISGTVIKHHYYPKIKRCTQKLSIRKIGYIGDPSYLLPDLDIITKTLGRANVTLLINPASLCDADALLSVRAGIHSNYFDNKYKPYIKIANSAAAGIPIFISTSQSCLNYYDDSPSIIRFSNYKQLEEKIRYYQDKHHYISACNIAYSQKYKFDPCSICNQYEDFFAKITKSIKLS